MSLFWSFFQTLGFPKYSFSESLYLTAFSAAGHCYYIGVCWYGGKEWEGETFYNLTTKSKCLCLCLGAMTFTRTFHLIFSPSPGCTILNLPPWNSDICWLYSSLPLPSVKQEVYRVLEWEECPFLDWDKMLLKSFPLKYRALLWRNLLVYVSMIILPLPMPKPWGDLSQIFTMETWWGPWRWHSQKCGVP